jgi:hypothetical protein
VKEDIEDYKEVVVDNIQEECLGLDKFLVQVVDFQVVGFHYKDCVLIIVLLILWNHSP